MRKRNYAKKAGAVRLFGASEAPAEKRGVVIPQFDRLDYNKHIELLKTEMRTEDFERTWVDRANMSIEEACEYALQINWLKIEFPIG